LNRFQAAISATPNAKIATHPIATITTSLVESGALGRYCGAEVIAGAATRIAAGSMRRMASIIGDFRLLAIRVRFDMRHRAIYP
jgi:hypothetical protein